VNGEAIYATRPWTRATGSTTEGLDVRFTASSDAVYAIALGRPPSRTLTIRDLPVDGTVTVEMLGHHAAHVARSGRRPRGHAPAEPVDTPAVAPES
jgi:alpha-L-fucosidase